MNRTDCKREYSRRYYAANSAAVKRRTKLWRSANAEASKAQSTRWQRDNPERTADVKRRSATRIRRQQGIQPRAPARSAEATREWNRQYAKRRYQQNPGVILAANASRRAAKRTQRPQFTAIERAQYQEFFDLAKARTVQTGIKWSVDHDVPLKRGGADHPSNLMLLPSDMNSAKGARFNSTMEYLLS